MSGSRSRNKGSRTERELVTVLRNAGWQDVSRIPLTGSYLKSASDFKPDVIGFYPPLSRNIKFEVKARGEDFKTIYTMLDNAETKGVMAFVNQKEQVVAISYDLDLIVNPKSVTALSKTLFPRSIYRTVDKLFNLRKLVGEAHILAIRGDRKPFLYIRYYD